MSVKRKCGGKCKKYRVIKQANIGRYEAGQCLCIICDIWMDHLGCHLKNGSPATRNSTGWYCNCCNFKVRRSPRNAKYKTRLQESETGEGLDDQDGQDALKENSRPEEIALLAQEVLAEHARNAKNMGTMQQNLTKEYVDVGSIRALMDKYPDIPKETIKRQVRSPRRLPSRLQERNAEGLHPDPQLSLQIALFAVNHHDWDKGEDGETEVLQTAESIASHLVAQAEQAVESENDRTDRKKPSSDVGSVTAPIAVWIALATLHKDFGLKRDFSVSEIIYRIEQQGLTGVSRNSLSATISNLCVANASTVSKGGFHRKIYRTSIGYYRLYKKGDPYHHTRESCYTAPLPYQIPEEYRDLRRWYDQEYCAQASV